MDTLSAPEWRLLGWPGSALLRLYLLLAADERPAAGHPPDPAIWAAMAPHAAAAAAAACMPAAAACKPAAAAAACKAAAAAAAAVAVLETLRLVVGPVHLNRPFPEAGSQPATYVLQMLCCSCRDC